MFDGVCAERYRCDQPAAGLRSRCRGAARRRERVRRVATAAVLNVVEPTSTGLGGDLFALYRTADGEVGAFRNCGGAPGEATLERTREAIAAEENVSPEEGEIPVYGPFTVTVPGTARGWERTVEELGTRSLAEVLQPAIRYAIDGFPVSEIIADPWAGAASVLSGEHSREAYLPNGSASSPGEYVTLPALGESMRKIAQEGVDVVYEGEIANQIVEEIRSRGGLLSAEDLATFEPEFIDPTSTTYGGAEIYQLPPNNQGLIALETLNIVEALDAREHPADSPERIHRCVEAMKRAIADGHRYITDPAFEDVPDLASKAYAAERAADIGPEATNDIRIAFKNDRAERGHCVTDGRRRGGNVVSFINSRFKDFGSGIVAGDTDWIRFAINPGISRLSTTGSFLMALRNRVAVSIVPSTVRSA